MNSTRPRVAPVALALTGLALLADGAPASAGVYNPITNCYDDPSGVAPPVCYNAPAATRPAAPKPDVWGALAVSPSTLAWGTSWNYRTQREAQSAALRTCRARDCRIAVTVPDVCVALATSAGQHVYAIGGPIGAGNFAADAAVLKCRRAGGKSCIVATSFCADGQRHDLKGETRFHNGNPVFTPDGQAPFGRR